LCVRVYTCAGTCIDTNTHIHYTPKATFMLARMHAHTYAHMHTCVDIHTLYAHGYAHARAHTLTDTPCGA
jgi:hypothetical protein